MKGQEHSPTQSFKNIQNHVTCRKAGGSRDSQTKWNKPAPRLLQYVEYQLGQKTACLRLLPLAVINTMAKSDLASKGSLSLNRLGLREAWQRLKQQAGGRKGSRGHGETGLAGCSSWFPQLAFFYIPGPPAQEWPCPVWTGPSHIINQENAPEARHWPIWWRQFYQLTIPLPRSMYLVSGWQKLASTLGK